MTRSDIFTSAWYSTEATHKRKRSAPHFSQISLGSTTLPSDFDIGRPCSSSVHPCVTTPRYGAFSRTPTPISSELWNHPRYWSGPSRYTSAGHSFPCSTARCEEPESNHTSRMSFSFRHLVLPQAHFVPSGSNSSAVCLYQASAPSFSNQRMTLRRALKSSSRVPHASQ